MTTLAITAYEARQRFVHRFHLRSVQSWWLSISPAERLGWITALLMIALAIPTSIALANETRLLNGINLWIKPLKFQISLAIHMATLAAFVWALHAQMRGRWFIYALIAIASVATLFEAGYITLRAGQGLHSHFDVDTAFEAMAYTLMGVGAVSLILVAMVLAALVYRRPGVAVGGGLRLGILLGGVVGFVTTLVVAGYMSSTDLRFASGLQDDAGGLVLVGWDRESGDLRVAHFFATHMFQGLPLVGLLADRWRGGNRSLVLAAALIGVGLVAFTFWQALQGQPFLPWLGR